MTSSLTIFISGITGVFAGMAMLFISIKATSKVVDMLDRAREGKNK